MIRLLTAIIILLVYVPVHVVAYIVGIVYQAGKDGFKHGQEVL